MKNDTYGEPEIFSRGNITARVYSPILTDEEQNRRLESVKQAATRLLRSQYERGLKNGTVTRNA